MKYRIVPHFTAPAEIDTAALDARDWFDPPEVLDRDYETEKAALDAAAAANKGLIDGVGVWCDATPA